MLWECDGCGRVIEADPHGHIAKDDEEAASNSGKGDNAEK